MQSNVNTDDGSPLDPGELLAWQGFLRAHATLVRGLDAELRADAGLALTEYEVLLLLATAPEGCLRISQLSDATLLSLSGASRLIDRLVHAGLVEKRACADDRRGALAVVTEEGLRRWRGARSVHLAGVRRRFFAFLSPRERTLLAEIWARLGIVVPVSSPAASPAPSGPMIEDER